MSTITTACPLDCPDGCSLSVTVEDEKITAIDAVPEGAAANPLTDGWICRKVRRMTRRIHGDQRLMTPLRRTGPKGSGEFEPIGWDEALDEIAAHIRTAIDEHGPSSVVPYLYNSSAAVLESDGLTPLLFEALEAAEVEHTICAATASKAWRLVLGTMPSADPTDVADSDLIVVWGANPTVSNSHLAPRIEARAREGAKVVVIDPRRTPAADRASRFLPVKPGTDVVLAMAAAAELERRGAVDRAFVDEHAEGTDEYLAACAEWTVERAAEVCGLEPEDITGFVDDIVGARGAHAPGRLGHGAQPQRRLGPPGGHVAVGAGRCLRSSGCGRRGGDQPGRGSDRRRRAQRRARWRRLPEPAHRQHEPLRRRAGGGGRPGRRPLRAGLQPGRDRLPTSPRSTRAWPGRTCSPWSTTR